MNKLIIVCGSPGSGKSSYSKKLASFKPAVLVDIDTCTETLVRLALIQCAKDPDDRDSEYFKSNFREPIYDTLFAIAAENLPFSDVTVIGPFTKEIRDRHWLQMLKDKFKSEVEVHYLRCDSAVRKARIEARGSQRDRLKIADWEKSKAYYGEEEPPEFEHVLIDN